MARKAKEGDKRVNGEMVEVYRESSGRFESAGTVDEYRSQQRGIRNRNRGNADRADWRSADAGKLAGAVCAVTRFGFAIRLGYTKDGGAYAVGIIGDGEPFTEFIRPSEDIDLYLEDLAREYNSAPENEFAERRSNGR